jgi:hypothetical protein
MGKAIPNDRFLFIIGAMKCGTSSLFGQLAEHGAICPCQSKEPEYFSNNFGKPLDRQAYEQLWDFDPSRHAYALEASTGYTKYPTETGAAENMAAANISPHLIYLVRDPMDRIESHYNYEIGNPVWRGQPTDDHLINVSNYFYQLQQYRYYFDEDRMLVLDFDDFRTDPFRVTHQVYRFLGLEPPEQPAPGQGQARNVTRPVSRVERLIKRSPVYHVARWVPAGPKTVARDVLGRLTRAEKRRLTDAEREFIHDRLRDDMRRLRDTFGVDVAKWGF